MNYSNFEVSIRSPIQSKSSQKGHYRQAVWRDFSPLYSMEVVTVKTCEILTWRNLDLKTRSAKKLWQSGKGLDWQQFRSRHSSLRPIFQSLSQRFDKTNQMSSLQFQFSQPWNNFETANLHWFDDKFVVFAIDIHQRIGSFKKKRFVFVFDQVQKYLGTTSLAGVTTNVQSLLINGWVNGKHILLLPKKVNERNHPFQKNYPLIHHYIRGT